SSANSGQRCPDYSPVGRGEGNQQMVNNINRQKQKPTTPNPASSPPLNVPAQALSGDETTRPMALVNADREIVRKIMTEPGHAGSRSPRRGPKMRPTFFGGRPMHLSSKARQATCGEAGATPLESRL